MANFDTYGGLYNWYAATDPRNIAASGWRVPDINDYEDLALFIDADATASSNTVAGDIKEAGTIYWNTPNTGADNSTQFSLRGAGSRIYNGSFMGLKEYCQLWNADAYDTVSGRVSFAVHDSETFTTWISTTGPASNKKKQDYLYV